MIQEKVARISISLPDDLLSEFDEISRHLGYNERSKAIQTALRNFMSEYEWERSRSGSGAGAILLVYDPNIKALEHTLTEIQHHHQKIVTSVMHLHLNEHNCLEVIAVKGENRRIKEFTKQLFKQRGIKQVKLSFLKPSTS